MQTCEVAPERDHFIGFLEKSCVSNHGLTASRAVNGVISRFRAALRSVPCPSTQLTHDLVKVPTGTRGDKFSCQARIQPQFQLPRKIIPAQNHVPVFQSPSAIPQKSTPFPAGRLDQRSRMASTTGSRGPPGPAPSRSARRRSRYLPPQLRSSNRNSHRPLR